jgi:1,4-alpha-glucan branching enzyme
VEPRQQLDWYLLQYPEHQGVQRLVGDLNRLYREEPALHEQDCQPQGFQWLIGDDAHQQRVRLAALEQQWRAGAGGGQLHPGAA